MHVSTQETEHLNKTNTQKSTKQATTKLSLYALPAVSICILLSDVSFSSMILVLVPFDSLCQLLYRSIMRISTTRNIHDNVAVSQYTIKQQ